MKNGVSYNVIMTLCLSLLISCSFFSAHCAPSLDEVSRIKFINNNHIPKKVLVVYNFSTGQFVKDLFQIIKKINETEHLNEEERIKLHIITSGSNPITSLGISNEDANKYIEVNQNFKSSDQWVQDCMELCAAQLKNSGKLVPAVFDSVRGRGLAELPLILSKMWDLVYFKNPSRAQDHGDYGGNLEVTPFDDICVAGNTITKECKEYLEKWGYSQRMFNPNTKWLQVGHIDEYLSFIPTLHAPGGYSIVRADPLLALELIEKAPESEFNSLNSSDRQFLLKVKNVLIQRRSDPNYAKGTSEGNFVDLNYKVAEIIEENIGKLKEFIRQVANDPNRDFAEVAWPCVFYGYNPTSPTRCYAFLPGVVNLLVLRNHLIVPKTYFKPFDQTVEARFRAQGNIVHFIDDTPYHTAMGEVHCGTNVLRDVEKVYITKRQVDYYHKLRSKFNNLHNNPTK